MKFKNYLISYFIGQLKCISADSELLWIEKAKNCSVNSGKKIQSSSGMAEYIKRKNEAWLKNKEKHLKSVQEHFKREKKSLDRVCLFDERLNGYGALGEDLNFSYISYFDFYVSEHDRRSHIRNTRHGPVLVRSHRVRAHKK